MSLLLTVICLAFLNSFSQLSFEPPVYERTGANVYHVEIADFNGDGMLDVVAATRDYHDTTYRKKLLLYYQNENGALDSPLIYTYSQLSNSEENINALSIGDLNQDGKTDVLIGAGDKIRLFYQKTSGGLDTYQEFDGGSGVYGTSIGDLNGDGLVDFAVSNRFEDSIRIFYQNTNSFRDSVFAKPKNSGRDQLQIADLNAAGRNDLIYLRATWPGGIHAYVQDKNGGLRPPTNYSRTTISWGSHNGFDIGDINGDGKNDMVATTGGNSPLARVVVWNSSRTDSLLDPNNLMAFDAYDIPTPIKIADLNCNGRNEIISGHGGWPGICVYKSDSTYQFGRYKRYQIFASSILNPYALAIGDLNNDGLKDIALANLYHGVTILYNNSPYTAEHIVSEDSVMTLDTLLINQEDSSSWRVDTSSWERGNFKYFQTDSTQLRYTFKTEEILFSSEFYSYWRRCGQDFRDTLRYDSSYIRKYQSAFSAVLNSTRLDSILIADTSKPIIRTTSIRVYPNPNDGAFIIQLSDEYKDKGVLLSIYDDLGRLVLNRTLEFGINRHAVEFEPAKESYHLKLTVNDKVIFKEKIIISH